MGITKYEALRIMGLEEGCTPRDIRERFKKLALKWHPDKNLYNQDEAQKKFQAISAAYTKLVTTDENDEELPPDKFQELAELWRVRTRDHCQFGGEPHLFCDCESCQAEWEDLSLEDFLGSDSDPDDDIYYGREDSMYADDLLKEFADRLYRNSNNHPARNFKKSNKTSWGSCCNRHRVTAEEASRHAEELLKAEEKEKQQAERKKERNKKKKESKKRRKAKQKDDGVKEDMKAEEEEVDIKDCEKEEVAAKAELVDHEEQCITETEKFVQKSTTKRQFKGISSKGSKQGSRGRARAVEVVDRHDVEEDPIISDDELDFSSAFVKVSAARAKGIESKDSTTTTANTNPSHTSQKKFKGQKPKPRLPPNSDPLPPTPQRNIPVPRTDYESHYGTTDCYSSVEVNSHVEEANSSPPLPNASDQEGEGEGEEEDSLPVDISEAKFFAGNIPASRQLAGQGNKAAKIGEFETAIRKYSEAIKLYPFDHRYFGNRSFCYDYIHEYNKALSDANAALKIDATWAKGFFRKGRALAGLKRYRNAVKAFSSALELDQQYTEAREQLQAVQLEQLQSMGFSAEASEVALAKHGSVEAALEAMLAKKTADVPKHHAHPSPPPPQKYTPIYNHSGFEIPPRMMPQQMTGGQGCALWIGNINSKSITPQMLSRVFQRYGHMLSLRVLYEKRCAFVNYEKPESAATALKKLQGYQVGGCALVLRYPDMNSGTKSKRSVNSSGTECYYWRTTGCVFGEQCRYRHIPENQGIDAQ